ncbi:His Kinase A (phosphoacceptor) domain protein [Mycobacteroides abscessus subsp. abscessus]|nr:His Kinase A (phosphoacceptor) domain protein [Mycobacteroides abscessus subsp. abscessus]
MQVIDNIMNNAIKYSPDGGTITARLFQTHDHVILSISDQGLGIPRQDLGKIFDRHGRIWVDSQEGRGSTFYISLPYEPITDGGDDWDEA